MSEQSPVQASADFERNGNTDWNACWSDTRHDVVLMNFGGPTKQEEVEPFLRRLFEDPLILRLPLPEPFRSLAQKWLASMIVSRRLGAITENYRHIGYSPINRYTQEQARILQGLLRKKRPNTFVHVANRYTPPFAQDVVRELPDHPERLFLVTLYPHFSHATSGTSIRDFDQSWKLRSGRETKGGTRVFSWWWHPRWIEYTTRELCRSIELAVKQNVGGKGGDQKISVVISAHGLPQSYADRGDQYPHEIAAHYGEMRRRALLWLQENFPTLDCVFELSFQSRVGRMEWTRPYTEDVILDMAKRGGALVMAPISFVSDHIETLHEMDVTYRDSALKNGFASFYRVKLPNGDPVVAECLADVLVHHGF